MAQTEAQLRASKKYHQKFDDLRIRVPAGEKSIQIHMHKQWVSQPMLLFVEPLGKPLREMMLQGKQNLNATQNEPEAIQRDIMCRPKFAVIDKNCLQCYDYPIIFQRGVNFMQNQTMTCYCVYSGSFAPCILTR